VIGIFLVGGDGERVVWWDVLETYTALDVGRMPKVV
jgi:hypothetical protein